jgi:hypothetical protein
MFLLNATTEIVWTLGPTATPPARTDLDLSIIDPSGVAVYSSSAIEVGRYLAPTDTLDGYASYEITPNLEGIWKIRLVKGTETSYNILDTVEMAIFDNTTTSRPMKYQINTVPDEKSLSQPGILQKHTGLLRWYPTRDIYVRQIVANVAIAPLGADVILDVKVNGSSILSVGSLTIAEGDNLSAGVMPIYPNITTEDYVTVDVTQRGSRTPGRDLLVNFKYD